MSRYTPSRSPCPLDRASRVIGDRWVLLILREAFLGVERFDQFLEHLPISRATLTARLGLMVDAGLLDRVPPSAKRAAYQLTDAGRALAPAYAAIRDWGEAWLPPPATANPTAQQG